ncbi:contractile injection system protein, VgrG/Pvc8 family [Psychrobacter sp. 72-O-c]|uniref:contractile injection system protein, VgrG/Pvc8 family n=1 Tax=Psychrobacter sp. 72-O-c TaxID=2774125 RepID=UPI001D0FE13B|nr:contractile injection system protein, VgrG/Pvc8 family [Psychrobacter sp. 72-O-c]
MIRTPVLQLTADDQPLNDQVMARLMTLSITDNKNMDADELSLTLDDHDGALELPKRGVILQCWMGYTDAGIHDMGTYVVDSSEWSGSPDTISIRAKSADFKSSLKSGHSESYHNKTLGEIANTVAKRQQLALSIKPELVTIDVGHIDQTDESDINLLTRLCHQYGAVVNIKHGKLLIFTANANVSASGHALDLTVITRQTGDQFRYSVEDRQADYDNVSASYQDKDDAKRKTVDTTGTKSKTKKLKGTYKSEKAANAAANAESKRIKDQQAKFSIATAYAYPAITTESPIELQGYKAEVDALKWTVDKAVHTYSKSGGLTSQLDLLAPLK